MLKLMILGRRAPGTSRAMAQQHLREVHGRLVLLPPEDAGAMPTDYVQNPIIDGVYPGSGAHGIERDLLTEIWFEDIAALRASTATPYYLAHLKPDEPRFVDDASVVRMLVREQRIVEGERGRFKAFILMSAADPSQDAAAASLADLPQAMIAAPGLCAMTANHVLPPPDGSARFADIVCECWFDDEAAARQLVETALTMAPRAAIAADRCLAVLAHEYGSARLREHYRGVAH